MGRGLLLLSFLLAAACGEEPNAPEEHPEATMPPMPGSDRHAVPGRPPFPKGSTRLVLLGTGTPVPEPTRSGPASAVVAGDRAYLVDFGAGVVRRAAEAYQMGISALAPTRLTRAFATHLHSDHTSGYADLILTPQAVGRRFPLQVYGPPGIRAMTDHLMAAYREDLQVRTRGRPPEGVPGYQVEVHEIREGTVYRDENVAVSAFPVRHAPWEHAFGYRFETPDRVIVISGDTAPAKSVVKACNGCDILLHEVYCQKGFRALPPGLQPYHASAHTSTAELADIAARARPKRLVLYHQLFFECSEADIMEELTGRYNGKVSFGNDLDIY